MRCYFHLEGPRGAEIRDELGTDVSCVDEARSEASRAIAELRGEDPELRNEWAGWRLIIVDGSGRKLSTISLASGSGSLEGEHAISCSGNDNAAPI